MSQIYSVQTKIDQFYKVVSNKDTGFDIKLSNLKVDKKAIFRQQPRTPVRKKKNTVNISSLVESEVQVIEIKTPTKMSNTSINRQKRTSPLELKNLTKKVKRDVNNISDNANNQQPTTIKSSNKIDTPEEVLNRLFKNSLEEKNEQPTTIKSSNEIDTPEEVLNRFFKNSLEEKKIRDNDRPLRVRSLSDINSLETTLNLDRRLTPEKNKVINKQNQLQVRSPSKLNSLATELNFCFATTPEKNRKINNQTPIKVRSPHSSEKKLNFSPKTTPERNNKPSPQTNKFSPRKLFFTDRINIENVQQAIENLNLVRQGSINFNEFDLESIYKHKEFNIVYSNVIIPNSQKFELKDIIFPREKHADHLLMIVMDVFANPMNCGYFSKHELDLIFSLFTLSPESQMLFVRLLKRKLGWHRISAIKYPEIASDLDPFFKELVQNGICTSNLDSIDILLLLNMLQVEEVKKICQKLKIDHKGTKPILINRLQKYGNSSKAFFLGAKSPKSVLRSLTVLTLQSCVCLQEDIINLFDRVITLLHPIQDPSENIADFFLNLTNVHKGEILYPPILKNDPYPIFRNKSHLIEYVQSKNALKEILVAIEKKEWNEVRDLGHLALAKLKKAQIKEEKSSLPLHVRKFEPEYSWLKVLSKSVDAFKKTSETILEAVDILKYLINENHFSQSSRGKWYDELALIEMHHRKDLESSAALTLHALKQETLTEVDVSSLLERLRKLMRRKNGLSEKTRVLLQAAQENVSSKGLVGQPSVTKTITANMANRFEAGGKSKWSVSTNGSDKYYGSVEMLALQHYTTKEDFHEGLHCEGSLPVSLFAVFFWDELYNNFVPGAFVSPYQEAPLDLFTADFFDNRKKFIEEKIQSARSLDLESFVIWMHDRYTNYNQYKSVINTTLFKNDKQFQDVVTCLGTNGVIGICEKLVSNFSLWRSGFPDLILWNVLIPKCKIVEVKGPGDSLSQKQKLWIKYLEDLGIEVEVCHVEDLNRGSK